MVRSSFIAWAIRSAGGQVWTYESHPAYPVLFAKKHMAAEMSKQLYRPAKWRPVRVTITVPSLRNEADT